jgi:hypothetical protein
MRPPGGGSAFPYFGPRSSVVPLPPCIASIWLYCRPAPLRRPSLNPFIYLSESDWRPEDGGCLRILCSDDLDDVAAEIPPALDTSILFVRSDTSWHGYQRVTRKDRARLGVQVVFHRPMLRYSSDGPSFA